MTAGPIIVGEGGKPARALRPNPQGAWKVLAGFAVLFALAAATDMGLALAPADLSDPGLRFVTLSALGGSLPLLAVGLLTFQMAMVGLGSRPGVAVGTGLNALLLALVLVGLFLFLGARGAAVAAAPEAIRVQVERTVVRTVGAGIFFGLAHLVALVAGWRALRGVDKT